MTSDLWFGLFASPIGAASTVITARDAQIDNVQLHYLTAGERAGDGDFVARVRRNFAAVAADHPIARGKVYRNRTGFAGHW